MVGREDLEVAAGVGAVVVEAAAALEAAGLEGLAEDPAAAHLFSAEKPRANTTSRSALARETC